MKDYDLFLNKFIDDLSFIEEIEGVLLSGSLTSKTTDDHSDVDLYVYLNKELSIEKRENIINNYASYKEVNNQFWETEDCFILRENGLKVELMYRDLTWIREQLERTVIRCEAWVGYTTCFYYNFMSSKILFDRNGHLEKLQNSYNMPYPDKLKRNIIDKNYPLLKKCLSSYYNQIVVAIDRDDIISINHRIAAFFASYFDIIFAVNKIGNPGEKKLIKIVNERCKIVPKDFNKNIKEIYDGLKDYKREFLIKLDALIDNLDGIL